MNKLLDELGINEDLTKRRNKKSIDKDQNSVLNNIPHEKHYNYMADLLHLPETNQGYKYLLVIVDLYSKEFDIEPMKTTDSKEALEAMLKIFKRKYIKQPEASIRTDGGAEFKDAFDKWLYNHSILHKTGNAYRHQQLGTVESLNKELARLFNGYMNQKEIQTKKTYKEWTDVLDIVRTGLNDFRKKNVKKQVEQAIKKEKVNPYSSKIEDYPAFNPINKIVKDKQGNETILYDIPKFKVGDMVHYKLDYPENALGKKQPTANFRVGDYKFSNIPLKIKRVVYFTDKPYYRYILETKPNVSYSSNQLLKAKDQTEVFEVKQVIGKKKIKNIIYYLIWFKNYSKKEATWEKQSNLLEDGLQDYIDLYEEKNKK
jgi:hypothetical protein